MKTYQLSGAAVSAISRKVLPYQIAGILFGVGIATAKFKGTFSIAQLAPMLPIAVAGFGALLYGRARARARNRSLRITLAADQITRLSGSQAVTIARANIVGMTQFPSGLEIRAKSGTIFVPKVIGGYAEIISELGRWGPKPRRGYEAIGTVLLLVFGFGFFSLWFTEDRRVVLPSSLLSLAQ